MRQVLIDEEKKMNSNERKFEGEKLKCKRKREERKKTTNDNYEPIKKFFAFDKSQREKDRNMLFFFSSREKCSILHQAQQVII